MPRDAAFEQPDAPDAIPPINASQLANPEDSHPAIRMAGMDSELDDLTKSIQKQLGGLAQKLPDAYAQKTIGEKQEALAEAQFLQDERKKLADNPPPGAPGITPAPEKPNTDTMKQFGSLASMIGVFASAFTKKPIVNALNASADAMKAQQQGNQEAYENSYKEWKDNNALALKHLDEEVGHWKDIMEVMKTDQALGLAQLKAYAAANGSDAAAILSEVGDMSAIGQHVAALQNASNKFRELNAKADEEKAKKDAALEQTKIRNDYMNAWDQANPNVSPMQRAEAEAKALRMSQGKGEPGVTAGERINLTLKQNALADGLDAADDALNVLQERAFRAGIPGSISTYTEPLTNFFGGDDVSEQKFVANIDILKVAVKNAMTYGGGSSKSLKADYDYLDAIVGGTGMKNSTAGTFARIKNIQDKVLLPTKHTIDGLLSSGEDTSSGGGEVAPENSNWESDDILSTEQ